MGLNTNRVARNTFLLYVRSILMMVLAIFTSRVLLATLGVEDYGIYNVVGGVVAMFTSIKSVLASSVQRFLNFYKGKGEVNSVIKVFNTSINVHLILAVLFAIIVEIIGVWFIKEKLVIPAGTLDSALFVFQCSLIAVIVTIITIPYDAAVIANEHMDFYAYISIADATLKLLIIFLVPLLPFEYLRTYAMLVLVITTLLRLISVIYCQRFAECHLLKIFDKKLFKEMSSFAGWNFLGCTASSLIEEGSNFILNAFGGVVANAARGIAYQVRSAINLVSSNVIVASQPFIMQQAGVVEKERFFDYIYLQTRILFYIISITCLPLYVYCDAILALWLKEIPKYTLDFTKTILIYMVIMSFQKSLDVAFKSYGVMAKYQIVDTSIAILTLPTIYFTLMLGTPLHYAFYAFSIIRIIDYAAVLCLANKQIGLSITTYFKKVIFPSFKAIVIAVLIGVFFTSLLKSTNIVTLVIYALMIVVVTAASYYIVVFNRQERAFIMAIVGKYKRKK